MLILKRHLGLLSLGLFTLLTTTMSHASLQACTSAPLIVTKKNVGVVRYFAEDCNKNWQDQSIRLDFNYSHDIPEWAFKRAAQHFLKKNVDNYSSNSPLNRITQLYRPVQKGDLYRLEYTASSQTLSLSLNQKVLGSIQHAQVNQYFKIWFGQSPFNAKLKQELLNE
ncbi:chalcone isomerase family protein [Acinetobacter haemolyticus]|uniref:chalcone isomerase family protein n=1 Tax=Acinetobacter haemolyticus TaxID=29430 RepID=UPI000D697AF4|nr:chalcone isomerase family protein [Acinetobacter haemolyticus]